MLLTATAFAQESGTDYKMYFGIKYTPDGYNSIQYIQYPYGGSEIGLIEKSGTFNFTSTFGKKIGPSAFLLLDLSFTRDAFTIEGSDMNLTTVTPSIGIKKIIKKTERVSPFFTLGIAKTFAFANIEGADSEYEDALADMNSPFSLNGCLCVEYFFNPQFSMIMDANLIYQHHSGKALVDYGGDEYLIKLKYSNMFKRVSFGFNMYF